MSAFSLVNLVPMCHTEQYAFVEEADRIILKS